MKIELREITFGLAVITWNLFLICYCSKIASFGPLKVCFERKKQKDMVDDGTHLLRELSYKKRTTHTNNGKVVLEVSSMMVSSFSFWVS